MGWILYVVIALFLIVVVPLLGIPAIVYRVLLVRTSKEKWGRTMSMPDDKEYAEMYRRGLKWGEEHADKKRDVHIKNGRLSLYGEYFDFGFSKAVIIVPGRMESCLYSYFFGEPYRASGYNVLVIDGRAHGLSDGKINSLGYREYSDVIAWGRFLHDELNISGVYLHGVCIGSSTSLFALTSPDCPDYFTGMTAEGMYANFSLSCWNHMVEQGRPMGLFPVLMLYIKVFSGADVVHDGPLWRIDRLKKPILFLHSREDPYSVPEKAVELYTKCQAPKKLVWFDHGGHSRLRLTNTEAYDSAISGFLAGLAEKERV